MDHIFRVQCKNANALSKIDSVVVFFSQTIQFSEKEKAALCEYLLQRNRLGNRNIWTLHLFSPSEPLITHLTRGRSTTN